MSLNAAVTTAVRGTSYSSDDICAAILLNLQGVGPSRATWLCSGGSPQVAIDTLESGKQPTGDAPKGVTRELFNGWVSQIKCFDADAISGIIAELKTNSIRLCGPTDPRWPFAKDQDAPIVMFSKGNLDLLDFTRRIAVVGTRRCTSVGRRVAHRLGQDAALAGASVVSGLALGIDGGAHRGLIAAGGVPIGVVATGLDRVYPTTNADLWDSVSQVGLLLSESPPGTTPQRWRFPARNRLIAALSEGVVVVESHAQGGSLITANEALARDLPVFAVPGSVTSSASAGTNELLVDGAIPARDYEDVAIYLGLPTGRSRSIDGADIPQIPLKQIDSARDDQPEGAPKPPRSGGRPNPTSHRTPTLQGPSPGRADPVEHLRSASGDTGDTFAADDKSEPRSNTMPQTQPTAESGTDTEPEYGGGSAHESDRISRTQSDASTRREDNTKTSRESHIALQSQPNLDSDQETNGETGFGISYSLSAELTDLETRIVNELQTGPSHFDTLVDVLGLDLIQVVTASRALALKGFVEVSSQTVMVRP